MRYVLIRRLFLSFVSRQAVPRFQKRNAAFGIKKEYPVFMRFGQHELSFR